MLRINIDELICTTVRGRVQGREGARSLAELVLEGNRSPIEVFRVADVIYLPNALLEGQSLQLVDRHILPIEAVLGEFTGDFVKTYMPKSRRQAYLHGIEPREIDIDVCILGNVFSRNFTHWHEELMKAVVLEMAGLQCRYVVSSLPRFAAGLLALIGIEEGRILDVQAPTLFRSVLFSTAVGYGNLSSYPGVLHALRERLFSVDVSGESDFGPRLWFHREAQAMNGRRVVNIDEVCGRLEKYEIRSVDFGALSLRAQIAAGRGAELMSGTHGSHFVHAQLMRERSAVIECFSPLHLNPTYTEIYRVLRHRYCQITGANTTVFPYRHGMDVEVDCAQLELALQELCH